MRPMTSREVRQAFLDFFVARGHEAVASSPLLPAGDATLLFTNAGMNQFKDVFAGRESRSYSRACSSQKCVRAGGKHNDLENVGYTARHHTFFEMLGNFSFGDYFKEDAIQFAWDLLVEVYELPVERLWFTVYTDDDEAMELWKKVGAAPDRILRFDEKDNFWSMGETGPCGPCSEIHFDRGPDPHAEGRADLVNGEGDDIVEIWNLVFMQFERDADGDLHPLPRPSIDTGAGLERLAMVMQGADTNYETDVFLPILTAVGELVGRDYDPADESAPSFRVIADHVRATTFLMTDGVVPSNEGRGYVLRRIIRRALRYGRKLGLDGAFMNTLLPVVVREMGDVYPELVERQDVVSTQLRQEEERFARTLNSGTDIAQKEIERIKRTGGEVLGGELAFDLYQSHGIPVDLLEEFAQEEGLALDRAGFDGALQREKERGQASWKGDLKARLRPEYEDFAERGLMADFNGYDQLSLEGRVVGLLDADGEVSELGAGAKGEVILDRTPFYAEAGGQVGDTGHLSWPGGRARVTDTQKPLEGLWVHHVEVTEGTLTPELVVRAEVTEGPRLDTQRNHTATHLLHAALRSVLGPAAQQAGSLVAPDRLRFDFNWGGPVNRDQLFEIERLANLEVMRDQDVLKQYMPLDAARGLGAMALFGEKYGETVRVVTVGDGAVSRELCGGCHVRRTGEIGFIRIVGERGVAAGVRRIEAVTGKQALEYAQERDRLVGDLVSRYQVAVDRLPEILDGRERRMAELESEIRELKHRLASGDSGADEHRWDVDGIAVMARRAPEMEVSDLRNLADTLRQKLGSGVVVLGMEQGGKATLLVASTEDVLDRAPAGAVVKHLAGIVGGRGGGRPNLAQAGGPDAGRLDEALATADEAVRAVVTG
jgi:alanyl-tRNA synthetase